MLGIFKSAEELPVTKTPEEIKVAYNYWRINIMVSMYVGYAAFYFTRKSFNFAMPDMIKDLGLELVDIGILSTLFYVIYGCSKFLSGIISDHSNPRYFMAAGLICTGIINIAFGFSSSLIALSVLWSLNAFFQGWGWPPCSKLLIWWYSRSERGFWWSIWNTAHNAGGALIPLLVGFCAMHFGWRYGLIVPGVIAIVFGLLLCWRLRDKPSSLGLPSVGDWRNDEREKAFEAQSEPLPTMAVLKNYVLTNPVIWLLAMASVLVYVVRTAMNDWGNLYLIEVYGYSLIEANSVLTFFEIGGFIGSLIAGWGSDKFFRGDRWYMILIFALGTFLSTVMLWNFLVQSYLFQSACFFMVGFFIFGPQMLLGMVAAETSHKNAAGSATGFIGLFSYLGAALAGYPVARMIELFQWYGFFVVIVVAAAITNILLLPFIRKGTSSPGGDSHKVTSVS